MQKRKNGKRRDTRREILLDEFLQDGDGVFDEEDEDNVTDDTLEFLCLDDETIESYQREHEHKRASAGKKKGLFKSAKVKKAVKRTRAEYDEDEYEEEDSWDEADYEDADYEDKDGDYEDADDRDEEDGYGVADYEDENGDYEDAEYRDEEDGYGATDYEGEDGDYEDTDYEDEEDRYGVAGYERTDGRYEDADYEEEDDDYEDAEYGEEEGVYGVSGYEETDGGYEDANYEEEDGDYEDAEYGEEEGVYGVAEYEETDGGYEDTDYDDEDEDYEDDDYDDEDDDYEDDDYDDEDEEDYDEDDGIIARFQHFLTDMSTMDMIVAMLGIVVLAGVIVTGGLYVNAKSIEKQVETFASVGEEMAGISVIGESGLLAVSESARISNMFALEDSSEPEIGQETGQEEDHKTVDVALHITSIQSDIKIKFVNKATGKLVGGVPFEVEVSGGGKSFNLSDDDKDGIIYKTEVAAGTYQVTVKPLADDKYRDYRLPAEAGSVKVTDTIAYKKVDVADEVKTEAEVNVAAEDTAVQDAAVESVLTDTVEWVESTKTPVGEEIDAYESIPKANIPDPWTVSGAYRKMAAVPVTEGEGEPDPNDTPSSGTTSNDTTGTPTVTVTLAPSDLLLKKDESKNLTVTGADGSSVKWSSNKDFVATVSDNGTVTAVGAGEAVITASGTVDGQTFSAHCKVTVTEDTKPETKVHVALNLTNISLKKGETKTITATTEPAGSLVTWNSSNNSVATVSNSGTVTAIGVGSATITATIEADGKTASASCPVTVTEDAKPAVNISLDQTSVSVKKGATAALKATVTGANNPTVAWNSSNTSVATVNGGTVTAVGEGTATVTASVTVDGTPYSASCTVTVQSAYTKVTITGPTEVAVGKTITLAAQTEPKDGKITWSSDNEKIATVNASGVVTGVAEGSVNIKAACTDAAGVYATYKVTVKKTLDGATKLKDKDGNQMYYLDAAGTYWEATYDDYKKYDAFYKKTSKASSYLYTGWQTIDGHVYFYNKSGQYVTGEQVIQGAKYNFGSDGKLSSNSGTMGIDVSKWNGSIDWNAVKNSGVSYVIIRCGYRGSSTGALIEDPLFRSNIKGAKAAGLKVGAYFFSQAVNEVEAVEEASMALSLVSGYGLNYPIFLDVESSGGRGDGVSRDMRTAVCKAFCATVRDSGYSAGVYANKTWLNEKINTGSLTGYKIWLAQYASAPTYTATRYDMWQYSSKGRVSGINGNVDMNISYMSY